jgi:diguanylate cyclase (GGDEF)-like protein
LTSIYNRRYFDQHLDEEIKRAITNKHALACIFLDVDHFNEYNDGYGHQAGDDCLKQIAKVLGETLHRSSDIVARYGGEEFIVVLPDTSLKGAIKIAEAMKNAVRSLAIEHRYSPVDEYLTVSMGVVAFKPDKGMKPETIIEASDQAFIKPRKMVAIRFLIDRHLKILSSPVSLP